MKIHTIKFEVEWDKFKPYSSFFIPCLNWKYAKEIVKKECKKRNILVVIRLSIEDGVRGIRVWRVYKHETAPVQSPPS
jgi:hypothetical protein